MSEPFIGEIRPFGFNFAPRGWALCSGQILPISQNQALFSLLGTTYGGDGRTSFALPDLRGRVAVHANGSNPRLGEKEGVETVALQASQMPSHSHSIFASTAAASSNLANNLVLADPGVGKNLYAASANLVAMAASINNTGGGQHHNNIQPSTAINYCIALTGIFPSRN